MQSFSAIPTLRGPVPAPRCRPRSRRQAIASALTPVAVAVASAGLLVERAAAEIATPAHDGTGRDTPVTAEPVSQAGDTVRFDESMLMHGAGATPIDTTPYERPNVLTEGQRRVDFVVNGQWRGVEEISFRRAGDGRVRPCYDRAMLQRAGVDLARSERGQDRDAPPEPMPDGLLCEPISRHVPGAELSFDQDEQKLYLVVPQFYMRLANRSTYVDPSTWTNGVPAALVNYNAMAFTTRASGYEFAQLYTGLTMGANAGPFRIRHTGNFTWSQRGVVRYQRGNVYAQTDLPAWRAQLLVGESSTSGDLFDAVSFRGVQISSDDRMLPDTLRYYAPVVRGVAQSNARVTIRQRGYLVHETTVAPGPFEIDDLQAMSYGGDLNVTVTEANGDAHSFIVPFATTVQLLRPGSTRFSAMAGRAIDFGSGNGGGAQYVGQFTVQRGINNLVTAYGGGAFTGRYQSALMGIAFNTPVGGIAADVTVARTQPAGAERMNGSSIRVSYSKNLPNSGTNFSLLAYRYSTKGYLGLSDALQLAGRTAQGLSADSFPRLRNRVDLNISQQIGQAGNVYLNGSSLSYWAGRGQTLSFTLGYSKQWRDVTLSASVQRVRNMSAGMSSFGRPEGNTLASVSVSIPLDRNARRAPTFNTLVTHDSSAGTSAMAGVSGRFGEQGDGSYSLSATYDGSNRASSGSVGVGYRMPTASLAGNFGMGSGYQQASLSASGGLVVHPGGVTPGPTLGETVGVVRAPDAQGASVGNSDARVNRFGYAIVPSLVPYQLNRIDTDPKDVADDVEMTTVSRSVAPRAGAVVMLSYDTVKARALLIDATTEDGRPLPFAARALDARTGAPLGAVGQGSRLFVRSGEHDGRIRVEWGQRQDQQCAIDYSVPAEQRAGTGYVTLTRVCRSPASLPPRAGRP